MRREKKTLRYLAARRCTCSAFQLHPRHTCLSFVLRYASDGLSKKCNHAPFLAPFFINCSCWHIHASSIPFFLFDFYSSRYSLPLYLFLFYTFFSIEEFNNRSFKSNRAKNLRFVFYTFCIKEFTLPIVSS